MRFFILSFCLFLLSCSSNNSQISSDVSPLYTKGKSVYMANCAVCHNPNPKLDGSLGPAVFGSSKELVTARVMHAQYPEGYKPKRESKLMQALPHVEKDIEALVEFLNR
ncbi:cytochrome c [bacterium]|nr:cytochrome c [bacterium]